MNDLNETCKANNLPSAAEINDEIRDVLGEFSYKIMETLAMKLNMAADENTSYMNSDEADENEKLECGTANTVLMSIADAIENTLKELREKGLFP